jgi:hypothetical protein
MIAIAILLTLSRMPDLPIAVLHCAILLGKTIVHPGNFLQFSG